MPPFLIGGTIMYCIYNTFLMQRYDTFQSVLVNVNKFKCLKKKEEPAHALKSPVPIRASPSRKTKDTPPSAFPAHLMSCIL